MTWSLLNGLHFIMLNGHIKFFKGEEQCKRAILYFERLDFVCESIFEDDIESRERLVW